jgi:hypothetical protein
MTSKYTTKIHISFEKIPFYLLNPLLEIAPSGNPPISRKSTFRIVVSPRISLLFLGNQLHFRVSNRLFARWERLLTITYYLLDPSLYLHLSLLNTPCAPDPASVPFYGVLSGNGGWAVVASMRRVHSDQREEPKEDQELDCPPLRFPWCREMDTAGFSGCLL